MIAVRADYDIVADTAGDAKPGRLGEIYLWRFLIGQLIQVADRRRYKFRHFLISK